MENSNIEFDEFIKNQLKRIRKFQPKRLILLQMDIPTKKVDIPTYQSLKGLPGENQTGSTAIFLESP